MDFLKILKSFEEFVYEALSWFVLLPKTLARIILSPARMSEYAAAELEKDDAIRYNDALSPPLLLILCVLIAHSLDLAIRPQTPDTSGSLASSLLASEQNLLVYRTLAFGLWALAGAVYLLLQGGVLISRDNLRVPLYQQCYLVSPFALSLSVGTSFLMMGGYGEFVGACLALGGFLWLFFVQSRWIAKAAKLPTWRALIAGICIVLIGALANAMLIQALMNTQAPSVAVTTHASTFTNPVPTIKEARS